MISTMRKSVVDCRKVYAGEFIELDISNSVE